MSVFEDIQAAAQEVGSSAVAARDRAQAAIDAAVADAQAKIAEAQAALQAEIDANAANAATLETVVSTLTDADGVIDSIASEPAAEEPPPA
jgi:hypothetical protein